MPNDFIIQYFLFYHISPIRTVYYSTIFTQNETVASLATALFVICFFRPQISVSETPESSSANRPSPRTPPVLPLPSTPAFPARR